jgi:hypothetical protein
MAAPCEVSPVAAVLRPALLAAITSVSWRQRRDDREDPWTARGAAAIG